jgi:hypothetical protein
LVTNYAALTAAEERIAASETGGGADGCKGSAAVWGGAGVLALLAAIMKRKKI